MTFVTDAKKLFSRYVSMKKLKMTQQRDTILTAFLLTEEHLTAEELYDIVREKDKSIGITTVYRMFKLLLESGIARVVDFKDGVLRYEHNYRHEHHDHLICTKCGKNVEVVDEKIEELQNNLAKQYEFKLTSHEMYLYGICKECRQT